MIVCETFCELDDSKAPEDLSSYAVRLLTETFVVFQVEYDLLTQMSRKYKKSDNDCVGSFEIL